MNWIWKLTFLIVFGTCGLFAQFDSMIPVLDLNDYHSAERRESFLNQMEEALCSVGFFAVINTGVDADILDEAYEAAIDFFKLSHKEKMKLCRPEDAEQRGYCPGESAKGEGSADFKEFYHVGRELPDEVLEELGIWKNVWPEEGVLQEKMSRLFLAIERHKNVLEKALAEILGVEELFFSEMTDQGDVLLRAIHYPTNPPKNTVWAAPHTDINFITILPRATSEGLQVLNQEGEWITVVVPENAFIVNCGDMLENITNGYFRAGIHRVIALDDDYERFSMVQFVHPRSKDRLDPLPQCIDWTGGVQKYANTTRLELFEERLVDQGLAPRSMKEHLAASGLMELLIELGRASRHTMEALREEGLASEVVLAELERLEGAE